MLPFGVPGGRAATARTAAGSRRGVSLVELMVVSVVLLVAMSMFSTTIVNSARQRAVQRENAVASEAARTVIETMRSLRFEDVWASYDPDPSNDPGGPGSAPGHRFAVAGLSPVAGAVDGLVGEVVLPSRNAGTHAAPAWELREDVHDVSLGMPRDLDGDHVLDDEDHARDYVRLPVRVELRWTGKAGERHLAVHTMLCKLVYEG